MSCKVREYWQDIFVKDKYYYLEREEMEIDILT